MVEDGLIVMDVGNTWNGIKHMVEDGLIVMAEGNTWNGIKHMVEDGLIVMDEGNTWNGIKHMVEDGLIVMDGEERVEWYQHMVEDGLIVMAEGNKWNGIKHMVPFHSLRSRHYYVPSSPQQPPLMRPHVDSNVGWKSFGCWTILHTHGKLLSVKNPAALQFLTLKPVRLAPTTISHLKALKALSYPFTLNGTHTQSMSQFPQGLKIYV
jgi:hypothetical protein